MCKANRLSVDWIEHEQPLECGQPQLAGPIFANVDGGTVIFIFALTADAKVRECLRDWVEFVEGLIAANPKIAGMVYEKAPDKNAAQAVRSAWLMSEYFEFVAVESIQSRLRAEPKKPQTVLYGRRRSCLRQAIHSMYLTESDIQAIDQRQSGRLGFDPCLRHASIFRQRWSAYESDESEEHPA